MSQEPQQNFSVRHYFEADGTVVEVVGELNLLSAGPLRELLQKVTAEYTGMVELDFRRVSSLDSAGLKVLLDLRKQLSLQSRSLSLLLVARSQPDRVLRTSRSNTIMTLNYEAPEDLRAGAAG